MARNGEVLVDRQIQVEGPTDQVVTVYRGVERESYSCMPVCQRRVTLGDGEGFFRAAGDQGGALNTQASGGAPPGGQTAKQPGLPRHVWPKPPAPPPHSAPP